MKKIGMVALSLILLACGTEVGPPGVNGTQGIQGPAGQPGKDGADGVDGKAGENGAMGFPGAQGPAGDNIAVDGSRIVRSIFCQGGVPFSSAQMLPDFFIDGNRFVYGLPEGVRFVYNAVIFANGNVLATGLIGHNGFEIGTSSMYAPTQAGATSAHVIFVRDVSQIFWDAANVPGWWELSLNRTTRVTTIVYHDNTLVGGAATWTMQPAQCVVNNY